MTTLNELVPSYLDVTRLAVASFLARYREAETERCYRSTGLFDYWAPEPGIASCFSGDDPSVRDTRRYRRVVDFHRARSARSSRTRPGLNGQPPSPTAGWDAPLPGRRALGGLASQRSSPGVLRRPV